MSLEADLYFVAWMKNGKPQVLVGGPFVNRDQADEFIVAGRIDHHRLEVVTLGPLQFHTITPAEAASPES